MTISTTTCVISHNGDGQKTVFNFNFLIPEGAIRVYLMEDGVAAIVPPEEYGVIGFDKNEGGSVTFNVAPSASQIVTIRRYLNPTQTEDLVPDMSAYVTGITDYANKVEDVLDRHAMVMQQLQYDMGRSVKAPVGSALDPENIINTIEQAAEDAAASKDAALNAEEEAEKAKVEAAAAKDAAIVAKDSALTAKDEAVVAKTAAETAAGDADAAKAAAQTAEQNAKDAATSASSSETAAVEAKDAAIAAKDTAVAAQTAAELAEKNAGESASAAATSVQVSEAAKDAAVDAKDAAVTAKDEAEAAKGAAQAASQIATDAKDAAETAATSATKSASSAKEDAQKVAEAITAIGGNYVLEVPSDLILTSAHAGYTLVLDASTKDVTVTLPIGSEVEEPFAVYVQRRDETDNVAKILCQGTDTINGNAEEFVLAEQFDGARFVLDVDATPDDWAALPFKASGKLAKRVEALEVAAENLKGLPENVQNSAYKLALGDRGGMVVIGGTLTIPASTEVDFPIGSVVAVVNPNNASYSVVAASGLTLRQAGDGATGNRTVAAYGLATLVKVADSVWFISGTGVK